MGVKQLWNLLGPVGRPVLLETMEGKALAIDSSIWIYQFQATMRDKDGRGLVNAHILGFLRRICKLLYYGIKPVFVFDGGAPALKRSTLSERRKKKSGAADSHVRVAERLLAAQLRREALNHVAKTRGKRAAADDRDEDEDPRVTIDDNAVYMEDLAPGPAMTTFHKEPTENVSDNPPEEPTQSEAKKAEAAEKRKKWQDHDPYRLPEVDMDAMVAEATSSVNPDPRLATEEELQAFIDELRPEDFNVGSEAFKELPTEVQYEIIGDLRLKSRQTSHKRLQAMLQSAETPLDFSRAQIQNLQKRNALTQQLLVTTNMVARANLTIPIRVASERNREYVLVKNDDGSGGWVLGVRDEGTASKPIEVHDKSDSEDSVTSPRASRELAKARSSSKIDPDFRDYRNHMALAAIGKRQSPKKRPSVSENKKASPSKPLFINDDADSDDEMEEVDVFQDGDVDPGMAIAIQESLDDAEADELRRAMAASMHQSRATGVINDFGVAGPSGSGSGSGATVIDGISTSTPMKATASTSSSAPDDPPVMGKITAASMLFGLPTLLLDEDEVEEPSAVALPSSKDDEDDSMEEVPIVASSAASKAVSVVMGSDSDDMEEVTITTSALGPKALQEVSQPHETVATDDASDEELEEVTVDVPPIPPPPTQLPPAVPDAPLSPKIPSKSAVHTIPKPVGPIRPPVVVPTTPVRQIAEVGPAPLAHSINPLVPNPQLSRPYSFAPRTPAQITPPKKVAAASSSSSGRRSSGNARQGTAFATPDVFPTPNRNIGSDEGQDPNHFVSTSSTLRYSNEAAFSAQDISAPAAPTTALSEDEGAVSDWSQSDNGDVFGAAPDPIEPTSPSRSRKPAKDFDAADEMDPNAEEGDFAQFISQVKGKDLDEARKEVDAEILALNKEKKAAMRDSEDVTQQMVGQIKVLLRLFGIPYVTAPMEAEAQCAALVEYGLVDGVITDDSDIFLFGGLRVFRNMFNQSKTVECFLATDLSRELGLDRDKLIRLAFLLGSDYVEGMPGVGPVVAMELLKEFPGEDGLFKFKDWWRKVQSGKDKDDDNASKFRRRFKKKFKELYLPEDWPNPVVRDAYYHPTIDESRENFTWALPDIDGLRHYLRKELGWGQEKVDETLLPIVRRVGQRGRANALNKQSNLNTFFDISAGSGSFAPTKKQAYASKRLQKVVADFRKGKKKAEEEEDEGSDASSSAPKKTTRRKATSKAPVEKRVSRKKRKVEESDAEESAADEVEAPSEAQEKDPEARAAALSLRPRPRPRPRAAAKMQKTHDAIQESAKGGSDSGSSYGESPRRKRVV